MSDQTFQFEKFMKDLEARSKKREANVKHLTEQEEQWQARELQRRYREHPHNRILVEPKK